MNWVKFFRISYGTEFIVVFEMSPHMMKIYRVLRAAHVRMLSPIRLRLLFIDVHNWFNVYKATPGAVYIVTQ